MNLPKWKGASQEMDDFIEALNEGDEERIKGIILNLRQYGYK